jgi:hypothetical protein
MPAVTIHERKKENIASTTFLKKNIYYRHKKGRKSGRRNVKKKGRIFPAHDNTG